MDATFRTELAQALKDRADAVNRPPLSLPVRPVESDLSKMTEANRERVLAEHEQQMQEYVNNALGRPATSLTSDELAALRAGIGEWLKENRQ